MKYLLDTCVISEFTQKKPSAQLIDWLSTKDEDDLYISVLTIGELQQGISKLVDSKRKLSLQHWLDQDVSHRFDGRILSIDKAIIDRWGRLRGTALRKGRTFPVIDSMLAATALTHGLTIVTRNVEDISDTGVAIRNPWTDYNK
jgi:hypothetical protein